MKVALNDNVLFSLLHFFCDHYDVCYARKNSIKFQIKKSRSSTTYCAYDIFIMTFFRCFELTRKQMKKTDEFVSIHFENGDRQIPTKKEEI